MSKIKMVSDALENAKDFIPGQKQMDAMFDFGDDMANAGKKVIDDLGQGAKQAVINTAKAIDNNPIAKATAANGAKLTETFSPKMMTDMTKAMDSGVDRKTAFNQTWDNSSWLDKAEMALMFTPAINAGKVLTKAVGIAKTGGELTAKQLANVEKAIGNSIKKVQKGIFSQADEAAKLAPVADDVVKQSDELAESGLDFSQAGKDKLTKAGFNPNANMSKAADDVAKEATETTTQKLDVSKLKAEGKARAEAEIKSTDVIEKEIQDPQKLNMFQKLIAKFGKDKVEKDIAKDPIKWGKILGISTGIVGALGGAGYLASSIGSDTNDTIKSIDNEQAKQDASSSMSKAPDSTTQTQAQDQIALTLETRKLPNGLLPHQVISREMGLNWNKSRDEIDDGLKSMGYDLSKVGKPGSAERNIAMANYVVQLKNKYPEKFKQLQNSAVNINI